jgi:hypothetical protein
MARTITKIEVYKTFFAYRATYLFQMVGTAANATGQPFANNSSIATMGRWFFRMSAGSTVISSTYYNSDTLILNDCITDGLIVPIKTYNNPTNGTITISNADLFPATNYLSTTAAAYLSKVVIVDGTENYEILNPASLPVHVSYRLKITSNENGIINTFYHPTITADPIRVTLNGTSPIADANLASDRTASRIYPASTENRIKLMKSGTAFTDTSTITDFYTNHYIGAKIFAYSPEASPADTLVVKIPAAALTNPLLSTHAAITLNNDTVNLVTCPRNWERSYIGSVLQTNINSITDTTVKEFVRQYSLGSGWVRYYLGDIVNSKINPTGRAINTSKNIEISESDTPVGTNIITIALPTSVPWGIVAPTLTYGEATKLTGIIESTYSIPLSISQSLLDNVDGSFRIKMEITSVRYKVATATTTGFTTGTLIADNKFFYSREFASSLNTTTNTTADLTMAILDAAISNFVTLGATYLVFAEVKASALEIKLDGSWYATNAVPPTDTAQYLLNIGGATINATSAVGGKTTTQKHSLTGAQMKLTFNNLFPASVKDTKVIISTLSTSVELWSGTSRLLIISSTSRSVALTNHTTTTTTGYLTFLFGSDTSCTIGTSRFYRLTLGGKTYDSSTFNITTGGGS